MKMSFVRIAMDTDPCAEQGIFALAVQTPSNTHRHIRRLAEGCGFLKPQNIGYSYAPFKYKDLFYVLACVTVTVKKQRCP